MARCLKYGRRSEDGKCDEESGLVFRFWVWGLGF